MPPDRTVDKPQEQFPSSLIAAIDGIPVLPPLVARISSVVSNPESSVDAIVSALRMDPILSGKVLKLSNSAFVGIPRTISSLKNAVVLLGQKRIHSLVLASGVTSAFRNRDSVPFALHNYWKHSSVVAAIAETTAKHLKRYEAIETEEVFAAGLLHDIGRMVLGCFFASTVESARELASREKVPVYEKETAPMTHAGVGALLADHWNFPQALRDAIAYHHCPGCAGDNVRLASIVHIADILAHVVGAHTFDMEAIPRLSPEAQSHVQLPPERLKVIADETLQNEKKLESFLSFLA
jgi:putative nucleotidyltransferase with HDIG domain